MEASGELRRREVYRSPAEIAELVGEFEACTLRRERWTHDAHLTVALWYLTRGAADEASRRIREGIQKYNHACGIVTTKDSGYHETITQFYIRVVARYLEGAPKGCSINDLANGLIAACGDRSLPLRYYSRDRLMSWEARSRWVEPDLRPFD